MAQDANDETPKDVQCTECGEWMRWGREYYDEDDNAYCPEHKSETW